mgnify:CR=1 FL=1
MKRILTILIATTTLCEAFAQFNPDLDAIKGRRRAQVRNDLLWHPEAANTTARHAGNASITTASRFGLTDRWELSTFLAFDFFQPNLIAKYRWTAKPKNWFLASKINVGYAYPGLKFAQQRGYTDYVTATDKLPQVVELGHEFIVSRRFAHDANCSDGSEWLILTASIGTYYGIEVKEGTIEQLPAHFLANRCIPLIDNDILISLKLWCDYKTTNWLNLHGGMRFHNWSFEKNFAFELQAEAEAFITPIFSIRLGGAFSAANYKSTRHKVGGIPMIDLTYYFGKKNDHERNLFNPNGKLY